MKTLLAAGAAVGARLGGLVPEFAFAAQPTNVRPAVTPFHSVEPISQEEVTGPEKQALVARISTGADLRAVSGQLNRAPADLSSLEVQAVRHRLADGEEVLAVAAMLDSDHVFSHYETSKPRPGEAPSFAFVYNLTDPAVGQLVAASAGGHAIRRSSEPSQLPSDAALAYSWCPYCFSPCNPSCCGVNWQNAAYCCAACRGICRWGPACIACILTWCMFCVWRNCRWCNTQCCFNGCTG